ncbi:MAG: hypothetical protein L3K52_09890 [Candidatus Thiothrix sulfatifontis]|nr:MAG: hypothetical protein L3K52_09890 [Candidatus Thiothrix sulfatifontis]
MNTKEIQGFEGYKVAFGLLDKALGHMERVPEEDTPQNKLLAAIAVILLQMAKPKR